MMVMDILINRAWAISIMNKWGLEMRNAIQQLFNDGHPLKPARRQKDASDEFLNKEVQALLKREGVSSQTVMK